MSKLGFSFSWKRALGVSAAKQRFARQTGIQLMANTHSYTITLDNNK